MSIEFISLNNPNKFFNVNDFEKSVHDFLAPTKCKIAKVFILNNFPAIISSNCNIDLLLIIIIKDQEEDNYLKIKKVEGVNSYLHN
jgi:hypothetical protein